MGKSSNLLLEGLICKYHIQHGPLKPLLQNGDGILLQYSFERPSPLPVVDLCSEVVNERRQVLA